MVFKQIGIISCAGRGMFWLGSIIVLSACGGGTGLGSSDVEEAEKSVMQQLSENWNDYRDGNFEATIEAFAATIQAADNTEGLDNIRNQIVAEAQNGIAWSQFKLQDLGAADLSFEMATNLDRSNVDAWVGRAGVGLAKQSYEEVIQFCITALERDPGYASATRVDAADNPLGHDNVDTRHIRMTLAEAYFQLGRFSALEYPDPNNAAAQLRLILGDFKYHDPAQLLDEMSQAALMLSTESET